MPIVHTVVQDIVHKGYDDLKVMIENDRPTV